MIVGKVAGETFEPTDSFMKSFTECQKGRKDFSDFPFDRPIKFMMTMEGKSYYEEEDGTVWCVWNWMLTHLCEIEVEK